MIEKFYLKRRVAYYLKNVIPVNIILAFYGTNVEIMVMPTTLLS